MDGRAMESVRLKNVWMWWSRSRVSALVAGSGSARSVSVGKQACGTETKVKCLMGAWTPYRMGV